MFAPRKTEHQRRHAAPASSLRERRQQPAPNQRRQERITQSPPTQAVRNQFIAPVGGGRSHIHPNNDGFSHQEPECATSPPTSDSDSPWATAWGFCTTRSLPATCRRRVEPPCSAIPPPPTPRPLKRATTARPSPRLAQGARERRTHALAPHRTTRGHLNNQKIRRFKLQRTNSYRTKIHS